MFKDVFVFNLYVPIKGKRACPFFNLIHIYIYLSVFHFTYLIFTPLDFENHEDDEHVQLQPVNGELPIVGGYILFPEQESIVLKRLKGNHIYSVAINQFMIIKTLPISELFCSV